MRVINQWNFGQILECQAPLHKSKAPIEDFLAMVLAAFCRIVTFIVLLSNRDWCKRRIVLQHF